MTDNEFLDDLERLAEENDSDFEEAKESFEEKLEEIRSNSQGLSEEKMQNLAFRSVRTDILKNDRVPTTLVEIATVGGSVRSWNEYDDDGNVVGERDVFVGKGLVDTDPDDEEEGRSEFLATIIAGEEDVEPTEFYNGFSEVGNVVRGRFSVSESDVGNFRVLNARDETEIEVIEPPERQDVIDKINEYVDEVSIDELGDKQNLSATERNDNGDLFPADFGVDIRRMEADVFDGYKNPSEGNGAYTVRDDTVFDEEDVKDSAVFNPDEANENQTPGMTVYADPSDMEYGTGTTCVFYGVLRQREDTGEVLMEADALYPVAEFMAEDFDGYVDNSGSSSSGGEKKESEADRMEI